MKKFSEMVAAQDMLNDSDIYNAARIYLIEFIFKNGTSKEFWCTDFSINGGSYVWKALFSKDALIKFNPDDISSIWQKDVKPIFKEDYLEHPKTFACFKYHFEKK